MHGTRQIMHFRRQRARRGSHGGQRAGTARLGHTVQGSERTLRQLLPSRPAGRRFHALQPCPMVATSVPDQGRALQSPMTILGKNDQIWADLNPAPCGILRPRRPFPTSRGVSEPRLDRLVRVRLGTGSPAWQHCRSPARGRGYHGSLANGDATERRMSVFDG